MTIKELFDNFVKKWKGKHVETWDASNLFQCVDLATKWVQELGYPELIPIGISNAYELWTNTPTKVTDKFEKIANTIEAIPIVGDIVIWKKAINGTAGHVAIATEKCTQYVLEVFSQNDPIGSPCIIKQYNYNNVYGWFRDKQQIKLGAPPMDNNINNNDERPYWFDLMNKVIWNKPHEELTISNINEFVKAYPTQLKRSGYYDKVVQYLFGADVDTNQYTDSAVIKVIAGYKGLVTQLQEAKTEVENKTEQISRLKSELTKQKIYYEGRLEAVTAIEKRLSDKQVEVEACYTRVGGLEIDLAKCKTSQDTARQNLIDKLISFIKNIWPL